MHELGHVLGFLHEHQRPDRDEYISVDEDAIREDGEDAYKKYGEFDNSIDSLGVEYDYASIMHYSKRAFGKDGRAVFEIKEGKKLPDCLPQIGQRKSISKKDIEQINLLYKCPGRYLCQAINK